MQKQLKLKFGIIIFIVLTTIATISIARSSLSYKEAIDDCDVCITELKRELEVYILPLTYIDDDNISQLPSKIDVVFLNKLVNRNDFFATCVAKSFSINEDEITPKYKYSEIIPELNSLIGMMQSVVDNENPDKNMLLFKSKYIKKYYNQLQKAINN